MFVCLRQAILLSFILFYFLLHYRRVSVRHQCNNLTYFSHCLLYIHTYVCMYLCVYTTCVLASWFLYQMKIVFCGRSWLSSVTLGEQLADSYSQNQFPLSNQCLSTGSFSQRSFYCIDNGPDFFLHNFNWAWRVWFCLFIFVLLIIKLENGWSMIWVIIIQHDSYLQLVDSISLKRS